MLVDTHCHIHEPSYPLDQAETLKKAHEAGVETLICVGTNEQSSREAVEFAAKHSNVFASIGVHPHDTKDGWGGIKMLLSSSPPHRPSSQGHSTGGKASPWRSARPAGDIPSSKGDERALHTSSHPATIRAKHLQPELEATSGPDFKPGAKPFGEDGGRGGEQRNKLVAIGEIGLDYFYTHSPREMQIRALEEQIELALSYDLPVIFHVREAFDDFWPIFDNFHGIRGELHSFTDNQKNMEEGLKRGLYIGVNGISTFTKDASQQEMFANIPLKRMLFETDAPFLTPVPLRGKVNEPAFVRLVAEHHARLRGISLEEIAGVTSASAHALFTL